MLTDWQVMDIRRRQCEKIEAIQKESERDRAKMAGSVMSANDFAAPMKEKPGGGLASPPPRGAMIEFMTQMMGYSKEQATAQYEKQLKAWKESRGE